MSILVKIVQALYKKKGINAILVLVLLVEVLVVWFYCADYATNVRLKEGFRIDKVTELKELKPEDKRVTESETILDKDYTYYLLEVQITNTYSTETSVPEFTLKNQKDNYVRAHSMSYYGKEEGIMANYSACIPAGATKKVACILTMSKYDIEETKEITISHSDESYNVKPLSFVFRP